MDSKYNHGTILYTTILLGIFFSGAVYSLQAPFLPKEAEEKGLTPIQSGAIFSVYEITCIILSPVLGTYVNKIGVLFSSYAGLFTISISVMLFGVLSFVETTLSFFSLAILIRIAEAAGQTAFYISSISIISCLYPQEIAMKVSILEMCSGVGLVSGPGIGGLLYGFGGFLLPFITIGVVLVVIVVVFMISIPKLNLENESKSSPFALTVSCLKILRVWVALMSTFCCTVTIGFIASTLEPHLRQFNLKPQIVGAVFMINPVVYVATSPLFGKLLDRGFNPRLVMLAGALFKAVALMLIGSLPLFGFPVALPSILVGLVFHGLGNGALINGSLIEIIQVASDVTKETKQTISSACMGVFQCSFSLGAFVGPLFGGVVLEFIGFAFGSLIIVGVCLLVACVIFMMVLQSECKNRCGVGEENSFILSKSSLPNLK